jgi:competence protein ComEC
MANKGIKYLIVALIVLAFASISLAAEGPMTVHFLNVGQGDCALIQTPNGFNMLIDAGKKDDVATIIAYLDAHNVKKIDALIASNALDEHIGGMAAIINKYEIGKFYMPNIPPQSQPKTPAFTEFMAAVKGKNLKAEKIYAGGRIKVDPALRIAMLAPNKSYYGVPANYSAVLMVYYHKISFLFTGDALKKSEEEILDAHYSLKTDVLKAGDHGSTDASHGDFMLEVSPQYTVISAGGEKRPTNDLASVLRMGTTGGKVFRTAEDGNIVATTDGKTVTMDYEKKPAASPAK